MEEPREQESWSSPAPEYDDAPDEASYEDRRVEPADDPQYDDDEEGPPERDDGE